MGGGKEGRREGGREGGRVLRVSIEGEGGGERGEGRRDDTSITS